MRAARVVVLLVVAGCGGARDGGGDPIDACVEFDCPIDARQDPCTPLIGDLSQPIEVVPIRAGRDGEDPVVDVDEDATVDLVPPFQGGYIILLGARVRNVDGCQVNLTASLRDPTSGQVVALEQRPSRLLVGADGWGRPSAGAFEALANVAPCPNFAAARDIYGVPWQIEVRVTTPDGRMGVATRTVVPQCTTSPFGTDCECMCAADFSGGCPVPDDGPLPDLIDAGAAD